MALEMQQFPIQESCKLWQTSSSRIHRVSIEETCWKNGNQVLGNVQLKKMAKTDITLITVGSMRNCPWETPSSPPPRGLDEKPSWPNFVRNDPTTMDLVDRSTRQQFNVFVHPVVAAAAVKTWNMEKYGHNKQLTSRGPFKNWLWRLLNF